MENNSYQEKLIISRMETIRARIDGMDIALDVKTREMDRRLEQLNELRAEVVRDRDQYARKESIDVRMEAWDQWRHDIIHRITVIETRAAVWTTVVGFIFLLLQIGMYYLTSK